MNLTVQEFADKIGIPEMTYYNYRNGKFFPRAEIIGKIRSAFGLSADYLLFGDSRAKVA